ncbi:hypothetical protein [Sporosarcina sp. FSL K6-5500]|uniref:hypothetical protein n=1 Tax=Sporosarcina sp. FSL K6-5500 TaxID=2921558 RepID=UPI0030FCA4F3
MQFTPDQILKEAISNHNLRHIRSAISSYMVSDPADTRGEIRPAVQYVEQNGIADLWQQHDDRPFKERADWDEAYFGLLQAQLMTNFSEKRFQHTLEVGKNVHGKAVPLSQQPFTHTEPDDRKNVKQGNDLGKLTPILIGGIGLLAVAAIIVILMNKK